MQSKLMREMFLITEYRDFLIILSRESNEENWGEYYPRNKVIVIYMLDEEGNELDWDSIVRISCHELAHHIQFNHMEDYDVSKGNVHDDKFKRVFAKLLSKYYNGDIPKETIDFVKEEGLYYESSFKEKKRLRRHPKGGAGVFHSKSEADI